MKDLERIIAPVKEGAAGKQPPVADWVAKGGQVNVGEIDIHINAQGGWYHEGGVIERQALVNLFSSILWHEDGEYYLVTPVEKLKIRVDDVPFIAVLSAKKASRWGVVLNTSDELVIDEVHPVVLREYQGQWIPYIQVRYDLWARVNRAVYEQWINAALDSQAVNDSSDNMVLSLASNSYIFEVAK